MSRARNIKPGFFVNEDLAECSPLARLLFAGLWCEADREGRLEDRPKRLKISCLPYDDCDMHALLDELAARRFIQRYRVAGVAYIQVTEFAKHQNPHMREATSTLPSPDEAEPTPVHVEEKPDQPGTKPVAAQGENGASTGCAEDVLGRHGASTVLGSAFAGTSPADSPSLIPDSPSLIPARAAAGAAGVRAPGPSDSGQGRGEPAEPSPGQITDDHARMAVQASIVLRKVGMRIQPQDPTLLALATEGFTVKDLALAAAEKALRLASLWNDPDMHPELHERVASGGTQPELALTPVQFHAVKRSASTVSIGYIASTLRGRRRDAEQAAADNAAGRRSTARNKPSVTDNFEGKTYAGTAIDKLPAELRAAAERAARG